MIPEIGDEEYLLSSYNYHLPHELIAQEPANPRDSSRLMKCDLGRDFVGHLRFRDLENLMDSGDILVLNDSRVIPARVKGHKPTGGKAEVLFLNPLDTGGPLEALVKGRVKIGGEIIPDKYGIMGPRRTEGQPKVKVVRQIHEGRFEVEVVGIDDLPGFLDSSGEMPVPPYIKKSLDEGEKYQTVYSDPPGSIAAPTAGLHFTDELLNRLGKKGIRILTITLHVSIGTFLPVRHNDIRKHTMEPEYYILGPEMEEVLTNGEEVTGVGTTVVKTLESACVELRGGAGSNPQGKLKTEGWSDLFIYPGHIFRSPLKGMLTNFHLPASTLIMLVSAYAGRERILKWYDSAVRERYRFYSFGDAMFLRGKPGN